MMSITSSSNPHVFQQAKAGCFSTVLSIHCVSLIHIKHTHTPTDIQRSHSLLLVNNLHKHHKQKIWLPIFIISCSNLTLFSDSDFTFNKRKLSCSNLNVLFPNHTGFFRVWVKHTIFHTIKNIYFYAGLDTFFTESI